MKWSAVLNSRQERTAGSTSHFGSSKVYPLAAPSARVVFKNPAHPACGFGVNLQRMAVLSGDRTIAIGKSAGVIAALDLAGEPAVGLDTQVVEVNLINQAAHAARQL